MDGGRNAVVLLEVQLGESVLLVNRSLSQISHGSGIDHVSDDVLLDGLVLGDTSGRVFTSNESDVSTAFLVSSVISALLSHFLGPKRLLDNRNRYP